MPAPLSPSEPRAVKSWDVIVVGGGHDGLVTAAYLGRAGKKVLVLERRDVLGGCAVTEGMWPGYKVSTGAYLVSLLQERIVRELELERFGYRVLPETRPLFRYADGRRLFFWQDERKTFAEIAKFSAPRCRSMSEIRSAGIAGRSRRSLLLVTPPELPPRKPRDFVDYLKLFESLSQVQPELTITGLVKIFTQSAADLLDYVVRIT